MKLAVLSDIHGNLEALEAVLEACAESKVTNHAIAGDIVGYGANPSECLEWIRRLQPSIVVRGNHDTEASEDTDPIGFSPMAAHSIIWTRQQLSIEQREWLGSLRLSIQCGSYTVVHSTLDSPGRWGYVWDRHSAGASFSYQFSQVCFHGHSHVPLVFEKFGKIEGGKYETVNLLPGHKYLINVCSVGQPRDGDPRAAFAIYDMDEKRVQLKRISYDVEKARSKILAAGLPERNAERLAKGL